MSENTESKDLLVAFVTGIFDTGCREGRLIKAEINIGVQTTIGIRVSDPIAEFVAAARNFEAAAELCDSSNAPSRSVSEGRTAPATAPAKKPHNPKLSDDAVREIREAEPVRGYRAKLARKHRVSLRTIDLIRSGRAYAEVV